MSGYYIIVCNRCKRQAQIIEDTGTKTTRCQNCAARLQLNKLRRFCHTGSLEEAIQERSKIQAELTQRSNSEWNNAFRSVSLPVNDDAVHNPGHVRMQDTDNNDQKNTSLKRSDRKTATVKKERAKDQEQLLLSIIREKKSIGLDELQIIALKYDIPAEKTEELVMKLSHRSEIYLPHPGILRAI